MVINSDTLKTKLDYLGMAISKDATALFKYKVILFKSINGELFAFTNDGINNIKVNIGPISETVNSALIEYQSFANFIKTCDGDITLTFSDKSINIKTSTVKCKLPLQFSATKDGGVLDPTSPAAFDKSLDKEINVNAIKTIIDLSIVKPYNKVCFNDNIMVTDTNNVLIINDRIFSKNILLNFSSILILNRLHNVKYIFYKVKDIPMIFLSSDELEASIIIDLNESDDFQYDDFIDLINDTQGENVEIDTKTLAKAMSTSQLFKTDPVCSFGSDGISLKIDVVDFVYKISDTSCVNRQFILKPDIVKKICMLGETVKIYYSNPNLIKCETTNMTEVLSVVEVSNNGGSSK